MGGLGIRSKKTGTKRKLDDQDQGMVMEVRELNQVRNLVMEWVNEVKQEMVPEE